MANRIKADTLLLLLTPFRTAKRLAQSNAEQWETHTRRRNRKYSDAAIAIVGSVVATPRVPAN
jgi:hypothetical protein